MRSIATAVARRVTNDAARPPVNYGGKAGTIFGGGTSGMGGELSTTAAVGTMFGIINRLSTGVSAVDWKLYRKSTDGRRRYGPGPTDDSRIEVTSHLALDVLNKPNAFFTRQELFESVQQHVDLTGEGYLVYGKGALGWPDSIWYVRPDKITPVPSATNFLAGYIYTGPNGEKIPLGLDEISQIRMPDPNDPYRGLSPVRSLLTTIDSAKLAQEWNRSFFANSALPGGVIQSPVNLSDGEFDDFVKRWGELHRGVNKANRIALLEGGMTYSESNVTQRDMQFTELRTESRDEMLEAFGMPKSVLGITEDVNRASAEAGEVTFGRWLLIPRLDRWKQLLNNDFLPLFGPATTSNLEFDYIDPIPPDQLTENATLANQVAQLVALVNAGFDESEACQLVGLPQLTLDVAKRALAAPMAAPAMVPVSEPTPDAEAAA